MLTVRNLPPEPTWRDWLKEQLPLIKSLSLGVTTVLCLAVLGQPDPNENWYLLSASDSGLVVTPMTSEARCRDSLGDENQSCVNGLPPLTGE